jgi:hypothetical protein
MTPSHFSTNHDMPAISDTALVHHHDETLTSTASEAPRDSKRAEREALELRRAFCAELKALRERRGITLHAIAESTKVSEALFIDLERCDLARWPTGIYRRAFFREYSTLVGLPPELAVSEFVRLFPEDVEGRSSEALVPGPLRLTLARPLWRHSPARAIAAVIDLVIVFAAAVAFTQLAPVNLWVALGLAALVYHTVGTLLQGCSFGTWWLRMSKRGFRSITPWTLLMLALAAPAAAQEQSPFKPEVGQAGKDVVWVPTPEVMVEKMLDMAKVTPQDYVIDLGSGDGRNVIGAAKRGASALGVEYNPNMVELSRRLAKEAGVADKAQFVEGDMFVADISKASVMALFLLPSNLLRLRDKFLDLRPGSRIVSNTFSIQDWQADATETINDCQQWCTAMLYIVPAKIGGTWRVGSDVLELKQEFQMLSGTWTTGGQATPVSGSLRGTDLTLKAGDRSITARVQGNQIDGTVANGSAKSSFRATR